MRAVAGPSFAVAAPLVAVAALLASTAAAHAQPGATPDLMPPGMTPATTPAPPAEQTGTTSYGRQVVTVDAVALGMFVVALSDERGERGDKLGPLSIVTYGFGAPIVHLAHKRPGTALASLTFRIGMPILGAFVGDETEPPCYGGDDCGGYDRAALGAMVGALGAMAIDALYLAKGDPPKQTQPSWQPTARATRSGGVVGVTGAF